MATSTKTEFILGLGSNQGARQTTIEQAIGLLEERLGSTMTVSPMYESPALLPDGAPNDWNRSFLNVAVKGATNAAPPTVLNEIQVIEKELGRNRRERWEPRPIDIDILAWPGMELQETSLTIPHQELTDRFFAIGPLADLCPHWEFVKSGTRTSARTIARSLPARSPLWMGVVNVTPDSFSDAGLHMDPERALAQIIALDQAGAHYIDIGAESTRPGARIVDSAEEWARLEPVLKLVHFEWASRRLRPKLSIDTRNFQTAEKALELGADLINDVSGFWDVQMRDVVRMSRCEIVLMHSVAVPASGSKMLSPNCDPVAHIVQWGQQRIKCLVDSGIDPEKITFDPGIGFGTSVEQTQKILRNISVLQQIGTRILIGHSRKSFLNGVTEASFANRDFETVGASLALTAAGVDILRVHNVDAHRRAQLAWSLCR